MREKKIINQKWQFHYGEIHSPNKMARKAHALGGLTAPLAEEDGEIIEYSAGGEHFLKLIAHGNVKQGLKNLAGTDFDAQLGKNWSQVTLPHDWKTKQSYENDPALLMSGSKADGIGYYRKIFSMSEKLVDEKRVILHFEGVMREADVWLNGAYLGHNNSGYTSFSFDITEMAKYGEEGCNVLLVRVDTTTGAEGWWYEGAGIYRDVWLEFLPEISFIRDSAYIYTKGIQENQAELGVEVAIENHGIRTIEVSPVLRINEQIIQLGKQVLNPFETKLINTTFTIDQPKLWSPEFPELYEAIFQIELDECRKKFGIRTFAYDTEGFKLNGDYYELRGVCEHQDFAGVGIALNQDIVDYKVKIMKEMGVNAWRSAHHFASEELLDACDRLGIILMNENRLLESTPWRIVDLEKMVRKSRMHASVAFWSVANEEVIGNTPLGSRIAKRLVRSVKQNDYESLVVSAELLNPEGILNEDYLANYDVLGVNYPEADVMGPGATKIKEQNPNLSMLSTESASYFSTRGIYKDNEENCQCSNFGSMFSMVVPGKRKPGDPGVGGTANPEKVMNYLTEHPYMGGVFLWTAFDYYGEPSPFGWPAISSQFGIADLCGFPKDYYYFYKAHWTKEPVLHLMPHWNREGLEFDEDGMTLVCVFSNLTEVELFINGQSYGKSTVENYSAKWRVPYVPGKLSVVAYHNNQKIVEESYETSLSDVARIDCERIFAGNEYSLYKLEAVDRDQCFIPTANSNISINVKNGEIVGLANGNPIDHSDYSLENISLFQGKALAIVRGTKENIQIEGILQK
jgi:beta-galactosidase